MDKSLSVHIASSNDDTYMWDKLKTEIIVQDDGTIRYLKDNRPHRIDGPAVIYPDGTQLWMIDGELHRDDGPACVSGGEKSTYIYYKHGKLHRDDGPAKIIGSFGVEQWYNNNMLHRVDGPAIQMWDGLYSVTEKHIIPMNVNCTINRQGSQWYLWGTEIDIHGPINVDTIRHAFYHQPRNINQQISDHHLNDICTRLRDAIEQFIE